MVEKLQKSKKKRIVTFVLLKPDFNKNKFFIIFSTIIFVYIIRFPQKFKKIY